MTFEANYARGLLNPQELADGLGDRVCPHIGAMERAARAEIRGRGFLRGRRAREYEVDAAVRTALNHSVWRYAIGAILARNVVPPFLLNAVRSAWRDQHGG